MIIDAETAILRIDGEEYKLRSFRLHFDFLSSEGLWCGTFECYRADGVTFEKKFRTSTADVCINSMKNFIVEHVIT